MAQFGDAGRSSGVSLSQRQTVSCQPFTSERSSLQYGGYTAGSYIVVDRAQLEAEAEANADLA